MKVLVLFGLLGCFALSRSDNDTPFLREQPPAPPESPAGTVIRQKGLEQPGEEDDGFIAHEGSDATVGDGESATEPNILQESQVPLSWHRVGNEKDGTEGSPMIVNGERAPRKSVPYVVTLQVGFFGSWFHICGGVLIASNKVLTAAHCLLYWGFLPYRCGLGWVNLKHDLHHPHTQTYRVESVVLHPKFRFFGAYSNDIAILTLDTCAKFNDHVKPIRIAPPWIYLSYYYSCRLSGWGQTEKGDPNNLQTTSTRVISNDLCKRMWSISRTAKVKKSNICELGWPKLTAACFGDSGGPLVCRGYVVGIVNWGHTLCLGCLPTAYARVSFFNKWIKRNW